MFKSLLWPNILVSSLLDQTLCEVIPVLQPTCFSPCLSGCDHFKAVLGLDAGKFCLALCLQNLWFIFMRKLATFGYVVVGFLTRKFKNIFENMKLKKATINISQDSW